MQEEIEKVLKKAEEYGWITINEKLNRDVLATAFVDLLKEMSLKKFIQIFNPFD